MSELASDLIFILIVLLGAAILGFLIGYVIGEIQKKKSIKGLNHDLEKLKQQVLSITQEKETAVIELNKGKEDLIRELDLSQKELANCKAEKDQIESRSTQAKNKLEKRIEELEKELAHFKEEKDLLHERTQNLAKALEDIETDKTGEAPIARSSKASKTGGAAYNLKLIEGIGPKIEQLLKEEGLDTWVKLSMANPDDIRSILIRKGGSAYRVHDPRTWPYQAKLAAEGLWKDLKKYQDKLSGGR
jgi:predicted flap endonuclease-1-like 5' DNA nuclease